MSRVPRVDLADSVLRAGSALLDRDGIQKSTMPVLSTGSSEHTKRLMQRLDRKTKASKYQEQWLDVLRLGLTRHLGRRWKGGRTKHID